MINDNVITNKKIEEDICYVLSSRHNNISCCILFFQFHAHTAALGSTNIWPTMFGKCTWQM